MKLKSQKTLSLNPTKLLLSSQKYFVKRQHQLAGTTFVFASRFGWRQTMVWISWLGFKVLSSHFSPSESWPLRLLPLWKYYFFTLPSNRCAKYSCLQNLSLSFSFFLSSNSDTLKSTSSQSHWHGSWSNTLLETNVPFRSFLQTDTNLLSCLCSLYLPGKHTHTHTHSKTSYLEW